MLLFNSQMHILTLLFIVIELILLGSQTYLYFLLPKDRARFSYLQLLALLVNYNILGSVFPDPNIDVPIKLQNMLDYGSAFILAAYIPWFFYKSFGLQELRRHALYWSPLFILLPFLVFFVMGY